MGRARWCAVAAMVTGLLGLGAAALAFSVSPPSLTLQAGGSADGMLSALPVASDTSFGCLIANGTVPSYLTIQFTPPCSDHADWSASFHVQTIPATPAQSYQITFEVCGGTGCNVAQSRQTQTILDSKTWTVVVTAAPVPVETTISAPPPSGSAPVPQATTPAPAGTTPAPRASGSAHPATTPSRSASASPSAAPSPAPASSPSASSATPGVQAVGIPAGLVLDHSSIKPGAKLQVSGTGCTAGATAAVGIADSVTGTTTVGSDGRFAATLSVPSSLKPGRYAVTANCGVPLSTVVDVKTSNVAGIAALLIGAVLVMAAVGVLVGRLTRRPSSPA